MAKKPPKQDPPYESAVFSSVPRWSLNRCRGHATARAVLFALGTFRRKGDGLAYPSVATLAELTGLGERTVQRALRALVECEAIRLARQWTQHMPNCYAIPDLEPALQRCHLNGSGATEETAPEVPSVQSSGAAVTPELNTELTTVTASSAPDIASPLPAVQDCIAIGGSVSDASTVTNLRSANRGARGGLTLVRAEAHRVMEMLEKRAGVA